MANWYVELLEYTTALVTVDRELVAGPFESYDECRAACVVLARNAVSEGMAIISETCYTGKDYTGNIFSLRPETEITHDANVKRDRFKSSAKALATWAKRTSQAYCGFDDRWITDILGEENGNEG